MRSLDRFARSKLDALEARALRRTLVPTDRGDFPYVLRGGRRLLSFSCNDYLGLSTDPAVKAAAKAAIDEYGAGAGASRLITGNHPLYGALEARLAAAKGTDAAIVFGSGYLANVGVISALAGPDDLILIDEHAHACLFAGAQLSGAERRTFHHNDTEAVAAHLASCRDRYRHALVVTETVFSMDGDRAPLRRLADLCQTYDTWLLADDAHGFGVIEKEAADVPLRMGTLSKTLGAYGGYLCASTPVVELIATRARSLIYTTGLPPASIAAALAALDRIAADPALARQPLDRARRFAAQVGLPRPQTPIVPLVLGAPEAALAASQSLEAAGFLVTAIRPPTVPKGTARLRFAFSALHSEADIDRLAQAVLALTAPRTQLEPCPASS